jgi:NAD(P)-dependent dehydrogenase (short-subunit alcohol dehydrogenase family)
MTQDISGLVGAITGGGDGIGRALALELAGRGMNMAVLDIRQEAAEQAAAACRAKGVRARALRCDVSITEEVESAAEAVRAELGPVNLIWANAGLIFGGGITTASREELRWIFSVNIDGVIETVRAFVPAMKVGSGWRWVGVTSSMGGLGQVRDNGPSAYCATRYACVGIAEGLKGELAGDGIGVTLICPGAVNTRIWDGRRARPDRFGGPEFAPEERGERWRATGLDVDEVAAVAVERMLQGDFYVLTPRDGSAVDSLDRRHQALRSAIHLAPTPALDQRS